MSDIRDRLTKHLVHELYFDDPNARIGAGEDLFELGLDSMSIHRLVVFLERAFGARIPDSDVVAANFRTLEAVEDLVKKRGR